MATGSSAVEILLTETIGTLLPGFDADFVKLLDLLSINSRKGSAAVCGVNMQ